MTAIASNIIVVTNPQELFHGLAGWSTTIRCVDIVNPSGLAWPVALFYSRGTVRTRLFSYNLDAGDQLENKGPYTLLYGDTLEIESPLGVEVTFTLERYQLP
jgi:hypothetical protein